MMKNESLPAAGAPDSTTTHTTPNLELLKNGAEILGKLALGSLAVLYVLGFVVVNIYLNNFGVYSLSLLRVSYITAGMWSAAFVIVPTLWVLSVLSLWRKNVSEDSKGMIILFLVFSFCALIGSTVYWLLPRWYVVLFLCMTGGSVGAYISMFFVPTVAPSTIYARIQESIFSAGLAAVVLIFHLTVVAVYFYGSMPTFLGSGAPKLAHLVLGKESRLGDSLKPFGVIVDPQTSMLRASILLSTDTEYVILIDRQTGCDCPPRTAVTLARDEVKAVIFERNKIEPETQQQPRPNPAEPAPESNASTNAVPSPEVPSSNMNVE